MDRSSDERHVIPFPSGLHGETWNFGTDVQDVGGAEGQWLRSELGKVVIELARWAAADKSNTGEGQAA